MVSATLSGTCPTTPGHCPSPRILFRIDVAPDAQSIRKRLSALVPHPASDAGRNYHAVSRVALPAKKQFTGGARPVFHIRRCGRQRSSGQWPSSCAGSTHDHLKLMRRSVRMRKTGLPGAGDDTPLVKRRWQPCSGQPIPDTTLSFSSATAGASPWLN